MREENIDAMIQSLNTAATGMVAQQYNLDTIANNLANVNTTGFKLQRAEFEDLTYQTYRSSGAQTGSTTSPMPMQIGLGANYSSSVSNFGQGPLQSTGNVLDMAINGEGFFKVQHGEEEVYTRDGSFTTDMEGYLVTSDGDMLVPNIQIPIGSTAVSISNDGTVTAIKPGGKDPEPIGNITVNLFSNPSGLTRLGQNLYRAGGASGEPQERTPGVDGAGTLRSSYLEGSNVQVVDEMVRMISAQRAYEVNSKAIQTADQMLSVLNNLIR